ncbi:677_t:CDS:2, partial [Gigaspora margarita]
KSLNYTDQEGQELITQIRHYDTGFSPYDLSLYIRNGYTNFIVSINKNQTQTLMISDKKVQLTVVKLEKLTETELWNTVNIFAVVEIMDLEEDLLQKKALKTSNVHKIYYLFVRLLICLSIALKINY